MTTIEADRAPLPATIAPFPIAPEMHVRPDLTKLGQLPAHVDDSGPASWLRLDDTTPAALEHLLREWQDAPTAIRAFDATVPGERWWGVALVAAERMRADGDPRVVRSPAGDLRFPYLGLTVGPAGDLSPMAVAPGTPPAFAALAPALRQLIADQPPAVRVLDALRASVAEDLVVMLRGTRGAGGSAGYLCVAAPSGWHPGRGAGASFAALHRPVPHNGALQRAAGNVSDAMVERGPFVRYVWSLSATPALSHHPERHPAPPLGADVARWWLRVERQTTLPAPAQEASLFAIRVHHLPLPAAIAGGERRTRLAAAVRAMDAAMLAYKGLTEQREALLRYLEAHSDSESSSMST